LRVIGAETAAELSMIIIGIVDEIETASTIATETASMIEIETTIGIGTTGTITTATANRRRTAMCNGLRAARNYSRTRDTSTLESIANTDPVTSKALVQMAQSGPRFLNCPKTS
jgi:hypothetical protein